VRPWGRLEQVRRWGQRNPVVAWLLGTVAVLLVGLAVASTVAAVRLHAAWRIADASAAEERRARDDADAAHTSVLEALQREKQANEAAAAEREANRRMLVRQFVAQGVRLEGEGDRFGAALWFAEALRHDEADPVEAELHRIRLGCVLRQCPRLVNVWSPDSLKETAISRDGRRALAADRDGTLRVWSLDTGRRVSPPLPGQSALWKTSFSPDGQAVLTGSDVTVRVWNASSGRPIGRPLTHEKTILEASFSPDGRRVLTVCADGKARVWTLASGQLLMPPLSGETSIHHATFSPDGRQVLTLGDHPRSRGEVRLWAADPSRKSPLWQHRGVHLKWADFSADGKRILAVTPHQVAHLLDASTGRPVGVSVPHVRALAGAFTPDGTHVLAVEGAVARIHETATGQPLSVSFRHSGVIQLAMFSPDGRFVFTISADRTARVWSASTGQPVSPPLRQGQRIVRAQLGPDGRRLITIGEAAAHRVWDLQPNDPPAARLPSAKEGDIVACRPDGRQVLLLQREGSAHLWDLSQGTMAKPSFRQDRPVLHGAFSPDGEQVLTADRDAVCLWSVRDGTKRAGPLPHGGDLRQISFTADGKLITALGHDGSLRVWDIARGEAQLTRSLPRRGLLDPLPLAPDGRRVALFRPPLTLEVRDLDQNKVVTSLQHLATPVCAAFSPDGRRIVTGSVDGMSRVWDAATGEPITPELLVGRTIVHVAFSPKGRFVATASGEGGARVWDAVTGAPLSPILPGAGLRRVLFAPDSHRLLTCGKGDTLRVWDLTPDPRPTAELIALLEVLAWQRLHESSGGLVPLDAGGFRKAWSLVRAASVNGATRGD
jgi:WD40 repeat protein